MVSEIFGNETETSNRGSRRGAVVGEAIITILFGGFGLYAAHRYSEIGLRVVRINPRFLLSDMFRKDWLETILIRIVQEHLWFSKVLIGMQRIDFEQFTYFFKAEMNILFREF